MYDKKVLRNYLTVIVWESFEAWKELLGEVVCVVQGNKQCMDGTQEGTFTNI